MLVYNKRNTINIDYFFFIIVLILINVIEIILWSYVSYIREATGYLQASLRDPCLYVKKNLLFET